MSRDYCLITIREIKKKFILKHSYKYKRLRQKISKIRNIHIENESI